MKNDINYDKTNSEKLKAFIINMIKIIHFQMKHRNIIMSIVAVFAFYACAEKNNDSVEKGRPNILFIMSDDHAYQAISAYDDRLIKTPNIDRLAKEGMLFTNACVTNSICAPSRAVILTGKHSHINGKIDNILPFDTKSAHFSTTVSKGGLRNGHVWQIAFWQQPQRRR